VTALLLLALLSHPEVPEGDKAAIAFLRGLQTPSGGFVNLPPKGSKAGPSLRLTRTGLRAFRLLGGAPADREAVVGFLKDCYDRSSGGFADHPGGRPDPISTSVALMALVELKLPTEPYMERALRFMGEKASGFEEVRMVASGLESVGRRVPQAAEWLKTIDRARNPDGSYGKGPGQARTTALYVVTQQRLGGKPESAEAVLKVLRAGQRQEGGFGNSQPGGSDLESCYRVVRVLLEAVGVRGVLALEGRDEVLAVAAVGAAVVGRLVDPEAGLAPHVQVAHDLHTVLVLQVGLVFTAAVVTADAGGQRPGDLKAVPLAATLVGGNRDIGRQIDFDGDGSHDLTSVAPQPLKRCRCPAGIPWLDYARRDRRKERNSPCFAPINGRAEIAGPVRPDVRLVASSSGRDVEPLQLPGLHQWIAGRGP
jgi:hypothetical protein